MLRRVNSGSRLPRGAARLVHQAGRTVLVELLLPRIEGVLADADQGGEVAGGQAAALPGIQQQQPLFGRGTRRPDVIGLDQPSAALAASGQTGHGRAIARSGRGYRTAAVGIAVRGRVIGRGLQRIGADAGVALGQDRSQRGGAGAGSAPLAVAARPLVARSRPRPLRVAVRQRRRLGAARALCVARWRRRGVGVVRRAARGGVAVSALGWRGRRGLIARRT